MKQGIHPENYRFVVFKDMSNGTTFLSKSTAASKETITFDDGNEYPVIKLEISNTSWLPKISQRITFYGLESKAGAVAACPIH